MTNRVIRPGESLPTANNDAVIFLAGPIKGGGAWQEKAIGLIHARKPRLWIASPRRLRAYQPGENFTQKDFVEQAEWEYKHLRIAARNGVILFWLPQEVADEHQCARSYAQTTRYELGEWITRAQSNQFINIAIGIEDGFSGARYLRHRLPREYPAIPVCSSLEDTCQVAIELLH